MDRPSVEKHCHKGAYIQKYFATASNNEQNVWRSMLLTAKKLVG